LAGKPHSLIRLIKNWGWPKVGERPSAYIVILGDKTISLTYGIDPGIAAQSIVLGANGIGFGTCMLTSIQKNTLMQSLQISNQYEILLVIALGKPREKIVIELVGADEDIKYWRDEDGVHHVPKRALADIIIDR